MKLFRQKIHYDIIYNIDINSKRSITWDSILFHWCMFVKIYLVLCAEYLHKSSI